MRIGSDGPPQSSLKIERPKVEPEPGTVATTRKPDMAALCRDSVVRVVQSILPPSAQGVAGQSDPSGPLFRVLGDALVAAASGAPAQGGLRSDVKNAIEEIEALPPEVQAAALADHLAAHGGEDPEDVEFRGQLLQALGGNRVGEMLANVSPEYDVREVLAGAASVYTVQEQGVLVELLGSENLSRMMALGVDAAGQPNQDPDRTEQVRRELQAVAQMLGNVYGLPAGSPGRAELAEALERLRSGQEPLLGQTPGEEVAAWMVGRSGSDALKLDFAESYLAEFRADPASLSPSEARSVALVLGSMEPPDRSLAPILDSLDAQQRRTFLSTMMEAASQGQTPEWHTPYLFNRDMVQGVDAFMLDVARLNPALFADPAAAQDFRVEAFRAGIQGLDNALFAGDQGMKDALANMFVADTAGIIHDLSDSGGANWDVEGRDLAKFLDQVAFRNGGASRQWVVDAMKRYLGVGAETGVADALAANKGDTEFMAREGNRMAREMGFLLGALHQGAQQALSTIDSEYERQKAVIDVIGSIAETVIEASPAAGAYKAIKDGTGGKLEVQTVFDWLAKTFLGDQVSASKDNVTRLSDSMISGVWATFFADGSLNGADSEDLVNLYALINAGVALADGTVQPSIRIGG